MFYQRNPDGSTQYRPTKGFYICTYGPNKET